MPHDRSNSYFSPQQSSKNSSTSVSVIIPTYNYSHYISDAIESVLAQTVIPDELIIIDDGSTDDTASKVLPYVKFFNWIKYYPQMRCGIGTARNFGIEKAQSKWIAFLDADDMFTIDKIEKQLDFHLMHPDIKLSLTWQIFKFEPDYYVPHYLLHRDLKMPTPNWGSSVWMFEREIYTIVGKFNHPIEMRTDVDWLERAVKLGYKRGFVSQEPLLIRRLHKVNASYDPEKVKAHLKT